MREQFDALLGRYWPAMEALIASVLTTTSAAHAPVPSMTRYHLASGGKRLRAVVPLLVAETLGVDPAKLLPFGAACEMVHNATLVHDDLQDGDKVRRGRPTVWAKYGMEHAINVGDAMFYYTLLLVQRLDAPADVREAAARRVLVEILNVIDGQSLEFELKKRPVVSLDDYLRMVEGKTSGLFALPMSGAAVVCGAAPDVVDGLAEAARHLGVLFQIQDDLLDLYADKGREAVGNDVREGKRSALAVHALQVGDSAQRVAITEVLDRPREHTTDDDVASTIDRFEQLGSVGFALDEIRRRQGLAREAVAADPRLVALVDGLGALLVEPIGPLFDRPFPRPSGVEGSP